MTLKGVTNEKKIWNYFIAKGFTACGTAGLMGNIYAESGLRADNLQDTGNLKLNMTDSKYTDAVDCGEYTKEQFMYDGYGYSLAQWTYHSRKKALYEFAKSRGKSIGDLETVLDFLYKELSEGYPRIVEILKTTDNISEASDIVLTEYERPANMSNSVKQRRAEYGQKFYDRLYKESDTMTETVRDNTPDDWAKEAVNWAVSNGILFGDHVGNYKLHDECTRQEMLIFLHRLYKLVNKGGN